MRNYSSTDEGYAGDTSFSETGSSSAGSRTTVPFSAKDEKKAVKGEYWEEDEQVKEEYGENTRSVRKGGRYGGGSLWAGELKEEHMEAREVKKERTDAPGWGSPFRKP